MTNVGKSRQKEGQLKTLIKFAKDKKKANLKKFLKNLIKNC